MNLFSFGDAIPQVSAVRLGRASYDNLSKIVSYWISINIAGVLGFLFALLLDLPKPMEAANQQVFNFLTTTICVIPMCFAPPDDGVMQQPPRRPGTRLMPTTAWLLQRAAAPGKR